VVPAPSAKVSSQFIIDIYGAVRRNIQEPGFKTIRPWKSQAPPSSTPFVSRRACSSHSRSTLLVHSSAATTAAARYSPVQCLVPISPLEMLSTVTPSSPVWTPTLRKNVQTTSSLASWSSKALAPSIQISGTPPPPSEHVSSLAMIQVHSRGIPDGLPGPLPPLPLTLGLQSQKSNALQIDSNSPAHTVRPTRLPPCVQISSLNESHTCHSQLGLSDNQILSIPTWGYDTSIEPPRALNTCWIRWSPESAQTVHQVVPWILRIPATNKHHHYNHKNPLRMPSYGHISVFARWRLISFRWLVWRNRIELAQMALSSQRSDAVVQSGAKGDNGQVQSRIVSASHFRTFGVIVLHFRSYHTICDRCATILNSAHQ